MSAFDRYDIWKTNPPEADVYPLRCDGCGERFFDVEDHAEGESHCCEPREHGSWPEDHWHGKLAVDWSYDWRDADPRIP